MEKESPTAITIRKIREDERERCAKIADDFWTLPPGLRTKKGLRELILGKNEK